MRRAAFSLLLRARLKLDAGDADQALFIEAGGVALQLLDNPFAVRCAEAAVAADCTFDAELLRANALAASGRDDDAAALFASLAARTTGTGARISVISQYAVRLLFGGQGIRHGRLAPGDRMLVAT